MTKQTYLPLAALLLGCLLQAPPAGAQPFAFTPFGPPGLSPERQVLLHAKGGPFSVITGELELFGGSALDWHDHPGVAAMTLTSGTINEYRSDGCVVLYEPGDVFYEYQGLVHRIENASATESAKAIATIFIPVGSELVTFVPPPRERPCAPGRDDETEQEEASLTEIQETLDANSSSIGAIQDLLTRIARALSLNP